LNETPVVETIARFLHNRKYVSRRDILKKARRERRGNHGNANEYRRDGLPKRLFSVVPAGRDIFSHLTRH